MSLTVKEIEHIAHLARLKIDESAAIFYAGQINKIMALVDEMQNIDTDGVTPMSHPQDAILRLRQDTVSKENLSDAFQAIAPDTENDLYLVPKVIEE